MFFARPIAVLPAAPCTISMHDSRVRPAAAVFASSVLAGTIASSNGSEIVTPMPLRTVRRDRCFLVITIAFGSLLVGRGLSSAHLKRRAVDDAHDERREAQIVLPRLLDDGAN